MYFYAGYRQLLMSTHIHNKDSVFGNCHALMWAHRELCCTCYICQPDVLFAKLSIPGLGYCLPDSLCSLKQLCYVGLKAKRDA